jgi:3-oxoacyl-[acyl-carrier protein] reductase
MELQNQAALVTGAAQGIGRAIAEELLARGAKVAIADINAEKAQAAAQELAARGTVLALTGNVAQAADCDRLVDEVVKAWGRIDILVNNAGITRDGLAMRMKDEDWNAVLQINLSGTFFCARAALKTMLRQRAGRIINIASIVGVIGNAGQVNYSAAKAGVIGMTKTLARESASRGVTVNAVAPGFIDTAMTQAIPEAERAALLKGIPLGRMGTVQEVAASVAFLASPAAGYITGQVLGVNGGMAM